MKEGNKYILNFTLSIIATLITHYLLISKIALHPTVHSFISLIILWIFLAIFSQIIKV